ncbi:glycosyltransferase family 2 protein, partial [Aureobasidium melanogenum]
MSDEARKSTTDDYAAGGAIEVANPFFASTNPFAKETEVPKTTSGTEQVPARTARASYGNRSSRNFSKKLPSITVPENGLVSEPTSTLSRATMVDTPMQTPTRASFASVHEQKRPRLSSAALTGLTPLSETEPDLGTSGNPTPLSSRQSYTMGASRRISTTGPPSAIDNRRPSLAGPRRSSVSVTNVVIPAHLMTHVETSWNEDNVVGRRKSTYRREDSRSSFNIQSMAQQQQEEVKNIIKMTPQAPDHMSTSMEALAQADPFAAMRERQTGARMSRGKSLAAVTEAKNPNDDESEKPVTPNEPPQGLTPWGQFTFRYRDADISPGAGVDPADPLATAGAALGLVATNNTNNSNTAARRPSMWRRIATGDVNGPYNGERRGTVFQRANSVFQDTLINVRKKVRRSSMWDVYENAKKRQLEIRRKRWVQITFEYTFYAMLLVLLYFLIIGVPLWKGTYWELCLAFKYKLNVTGSWSIIIGVSVAYAYSPLLVLFEPDPPMPEEPIDATKTPNVSDTALMIPCYKAANLIGPTLEAATKIFPPSHIFVVANGNSPTPLDNTEEICRPFGVNHIWSPVGSKIVAQFVGCYAAKDFKNVLLIDDDCALPPNFPIVSDRLKGKVMCMGYTIKSVGPKSSKGTLCQQAQDLEYKISGIQRALAGKIGSATFPHGAISLWDREFLIKTFSKHPGFSVSEDWFFGHVARQLGCRTQMATSVFIETETPDAVFFSSGGERGGFGEMTVFKQRFYRWNFFFVNGMYYNLHYILFSWKLGWWELGAKLFVFQEIYETLLYLATPIVVPVSLAVRPSFFFELMALTFVLYMANAVIFNELHLRRKNEKVPQKCVWLYYMPYKLVLTFVNVASCYYAIYKYATYFATRHPKIIEDDKAVNVVLQLEEEDVDDDPVLPAGGRRMSVTAVGSQVEVPSSAMGGRRMTVTAMGQRFSNPDITEEDEEEAEELIEKPERKASISIIKSGDALTPLSARRPSITVGGRRISASSATIIDEVPPIKESPMEGITSVLEESEEEHTPNDEKPMATPNVESKRHSKRKSQLRQSYFAPIVEIRETAEPEYVPEISVTPAVVDDRLLSRISAIEDALAARGIATVDFAVHDDGLSEAAVAEEGENEDFVSTDDDEKKHSDAKSMV